MPGINGTGNATIEVINAIGNSTGIDQMYILVNHEIFGGYLFFTLLWVMWIILFVASQKLRDQPLNNALYACTAMSILALVLRAITMTYNGEVIGLINDFQVFVFPTLTILLATVIWAIKGR